MSSSDTEKTAEATATDSVVEAAEPKVERRNDASFHSAPAAASTSGSGRWGVVLAVVALVAAGASLWWQYQSSLQPASSADTERQLTELSRQVEATERAASAQLLPISQQLSAIEASSQSNASAIEQLRAQMAIPDPQLARLSSEVASLQQDLDSLTRNIISINARESNAEREAILAEVEYLLSIAAARARLAADANGAIAALSMADGRLAALNDPLVSEVREQLKIETDALRQAAAVDPLAVASELSSLAAQVMDWPLQGELGGDDEVEAEATEEASLSDRVASLLDGLVVVRPANDFEPKMVDANAQALIRLNLSSSLAAARLAALRSDAERMRVEVDVAIGWMDRFFEIEAETVAAARAQLQTLAATDLSNRLPQPVTSLRLLRALRETDLGSP
ncbi:MAG: heme biosynthesis operon protein HemX [Lysobacteraceae bacterium]|nr:MAG: heme biosynthesis operon protein HemX [Xanthomonadaceae bacterium]